MASPSFELYAFILTNKETLSWKNGQILSSRKTGSWESWRDHMLGQAKTEKQAPQQGQACWKRPVSSPGAAKDLMTQLSLVAQSCLTLCDPMDCSTPGLPVHHQPPEFIQTHVHWVSDAIQPSHPLSSPSPPALNLSQCQGFFKWVSSLHQVAKVLEFQLQHQSSWLLAKRSSQGDQGAYSLLGCA